MNKIIISILLLFLVALAGCSSVTGNVPRAPSGGGCGVGAPADEQPAVQATLVEQAIKSAQSL